jgi:hypothetical protein
MKRTTFILLAVSAVAVAAVAEPPKALKFDFEDATVGTVPRGWTVAKTLTMGVGEGSIWKVAEDRTAPKGPKVLAQLAESPGSVFNLCVVEESSFQDVEVTVSFKAVAGKKDQGGGIVWRYVDANNYYIARMNPLEDNFRVYKVAAGKRSPEFQSAEVKVPAGEWHTLKITMVGERIQCFLDGKKHLDVKDDTFTKAGKVGLWTKADAQTYFDDFQASETK